MAGPAAGAEGEPARRTTSWRAWSRVVGQAIYAGCLLAALVLVVAAFLLVGRAGEDHGLVWVDHLAGHLDLGVFDVDNGVVSFDGPRADLKTALVNRGLAALVWVLVGRWVARLLSRCGPQAVAATTSVR